MIRKLRFFLLLLYIRSSVYKFYPYLMSVSSLYLHNRQREEFLHKCRKN
nr:MAG TPA: hypothetical protein [Caudoviricetes sp.]